MKAITKVYIMLTVIGLIVIYFWSNSISPSDEDEYNAAINAYKADQYNGVVTDKFIDEKQSNFEKVFVNEEGEEKVVLFNIETSGIFDFLEVGDTVIKVDRSLYIRVIRNDLDTLLKMSFIGFH